ncbi:hypothetical protein ACP275_12G086800 [Erythranthe tilingii]
MAKRIQHFWILLNTCPDNHSSSFYYTSTTKSGISEQDWVSPAIVLLTSTAALLLPLFPNGRRLKGDAPATVSSGSGITSAYHAFVVAVMFAFSCAISAVFLHRKQVAARVLKLCAVMWISFGFLLLIRAAIFGIDDLLVMQMS